MTELYKTLNIIDIRKNDFRNVVFSNFFQEESDSEEVVGILVEYSNRDKFLQLNNIENISAIIISEFYGIVYLPINKVSEIMPYINNYIFELTPQIFTLNDITPLEASNAEYYHNNPYISLDEGREPCFLRFFRSNTLDSV